MGRERLLDLVVVDAQQGADGRELLAPGHAQAEPHERVGLGQPRLDLVQRQLVGGPPPVVYCTAGTSTNGCVPSIAATNQPSLTQAAPCTISVSNVEGQKSGLVFYGIDNACFTPNPWGSGSSFLCVKSPTFRSGAQASGGTTAVCDGTMTLDWNAFQFTHPGALGNPWSVGAKVYAQGWYRDPPAPKTTALSDALVLIYEP